MADVAMPNIIPKISMVIISRMRIDTATISSKISMEPINAARTTPICPNQNPKPIADEPSTAIATPKLAPELMPSTYGPANGFLKMVCICRPLTANAEPARIAVITLGKRK